MGVIGEHVNLPSSNQQSSLEGVTTAPLVGVKLYYYSNSKATKYM